MTDTQTIEATATATFEVGKTYQARSFSDYDCVWTFDVIKRTAEFITLQEENGETMRVGVRTHDGEEYASPFGSYSMSPVIRARQ